MLERAKRIAAIVQTDPMREASPWKSIGLLNIVQELDKLESAGANPFNLLGLLDGIEIDPYVMDATARRRDDVVTAREVTHEQHLVAEQSAWKPLLAIGSPQQV